MRHLLSCNKISELFASTQLECSLGPCSIMCPRLLGILLQEVPAVFGDTCIQCAPLICKH